jgi:hypothetical protein
MVIKMFNDPVSLVWIYFLESQMKVCSISMKKTQRNSISGSEIATELDILPNKMKISIPQNVSLLSDDASNNKQFTEVSNSFYNTFPLYLEKWSNNVLPLDMLHWRLLKNFSLLLHIGGVLWY